MRTLGLLLVGAIAACSPQADERPANETASAAPAVVAPPPVAEPPKREPDNQKTFDFAGDWAVSEELCRTDDVWSFARDKVEHDGEMSCAVDSITGETATGATLNMNCVAAGTESKQRWALFTAPEGAMTVQRYENEVMTGPQQILRRCS